MELISRTWRRLPPPLAWVSSRLNNLRPPPYRHRRSISTKDSGMQLTSSDLNPARIHLRQYQEECIRSILDYLEKGHKRLGVSLATGSGKTVIFTQLIDRVYPQSAKAIQSLIIVHRKELAEQAARHCRLAYPHKTVEIEVGKNKASGTADITIASIQSLLSGDRIKKFDPDRLKLILVDEAHHIVAKSYRKALKYFRLDTAFNSSPVLVGVSATFSRFDGLKLGSAIDYIVYHKDYIDLIGEKWLSDAIFTTIDSKADLSRVRNNTFGDFAVGQLSKAVNTGTTNSITVRSWLSKAYGRKSTLVFCVDIEHVKQLTAKFREHGIDARYITGATTRDTRNEQLLAFKNQEYPVLVNCGLFTEGTDIPNIDCVLLARPTRSRNLLIQMIGRGLRLHPTKINCHIIDMVASLRSGVSSTPTLFGLDPNYVLDESNVKQLKAMQDTTNSSSSKHAHGTLEDASLIFTDYNSISDLLTDTRLEQHIRSISPNAWTRVNESKYVLTDRSGWLTIEKNGSDSFVVRHVMKFKNKEGGTTYTRPSEIALGSNLEHAVHAADTFASKAFQGYFISAWEPWRKFPPTPAQRKFLEGIGIRKEALLLPDFTRGMAADMINRMKFGAKKQFAKIESKKKRLKREEAAMRAFQELRNMERVKVGPLNHEYGIVEGHSLLSQ